GIMGLGAPGIMNSDYQDSDMMGGPGGSVTASTDTENASSVSQQKQERERDTSSTPETQPELTDLFSNWTQEFDLVEEPQEIVLDNTEEVVADYQKIIDLRANTQNSGYFRILALIGIVGGIALCVLVPLMLFFKIASGLRPIAISATSGLLCVILGFSLFNSNGQSMESLHDKAQIRGDCSAELQSVKIDALDTQADFDVPAKAVTSASGVENAENVKSAENVESPQPESSPE
ncbi:MAG: hypothetical protein ACRC2T_04765, partial [Thermoguttaceae bacterium]